MDRKQRRGKGRRPKPARHQSQREKQAGDCRHVQQDIDKMMAACIGSEQLPTQLVRYIRNRKPCAGIHVREDPDHPVQVESFGDERILIDVTRVIVIDKIESNRLAEDDNDQRRQS